MFGELNTNAKVWKCLSWESLLEIKNGKNQRAVENKNGKYPIYGSGGIMGYADCTPVAENDIPDIVARFHNLEGEAARSRTEKESYSHYA